MPPAYDLNKIKFATDKATFKRAVGLYESGKVTEIEQLGGYYSACKHMVALALYAVMDGKPFKRIRIDSFLITLSAAGDVRR